MQSIKKCTLCPRNCGAQRFEQSGEGFCGMGVLPVVARAALHFWEEPVISGNAGSGTVFFSGCNLGCLYCQNRKISARHFGRQVSCERLAEIFKELEDKGANNINLVTPTHFVPAIIEAFGIYRPRVPVVYNCGGYESEQTIRAIAPYVDVWLPDFKYSDNALAAELSGVDDYVQTATAAIKLMASFAPTPIIEDGLIKKGVIVRNLVLPGHTKNSLGVLKILDELFPERNILISLMSQFTPEHSVQGHPELDRRITRREYARVYDALAELDFDGFAQEVSSAKEEYIPPFDLEGVANQSPTEKS